MRRNSEEHKIYVKEYVAILKEKRRSEAIERLGGKCQTCGGTDTLEFDHIDPDSKVSAVSKLWRSSEIKFWTEVEKCQLLCKSCHIIKSRKEAKKWAKLIHGTSQGYRYHQCRCQECKSAVSNYKKEWRKKKREQK